MMTNENLKPCPFCGGKLHIWKQQIKPTIGKVAECDSCGVRICIPWALEEFQAVEFLNRRANDEQADFFRFGPSL